MPAIVYVLRFGSVGGLVELSGAGGLGNWGIEVERLMYVVFLLGL